MQNFSTEEVQLCALALSVAKKPSDALNAWKKLGDKHQNLRAIVSLESYERQSVPSSIKKYGKSPFNYLVPYFSNEKLYFLDDEIILDMAISEKAKFGIDYTLMFDTNIASYINTLMRGEPLKNMHSEVISLVDALLYDNVNFDYIFYMLENVKNIHHLVGRNVSKIKFWRALDKKFRNNIISLQLFCNIDCKEYKKHSIAKPHMTYNEAVRKSVDFSFNFYTSEKGATHMDNFVLIQRKILLQLIGMVKIQLNSNRNAKNKMNEFFNFIHEVAGCYFDREAIVAFKYFDDRKCFRSLYKVHKGGCTVRLLKLLDNIAWDMATPRFMESFIMQLGEGRYFVPYFLTFDQGLKEMNSLYPVKAVLFDKNENTLVPIPKINTMAFFKEKGCLKQLEYMHSETMINERFRKPEQTRISIHQLIKSEYKKLRKIIKS